MRTTPAKSGIGSHFPVGLRLGFRARCLFIHSLLAGGLPLAGTVVCGHRKGR